MGAKPTLFGAGGPLWSGDRGEGFFDHPNPPCHWNQEAGVVKSSIEHLPTPLQDPAATAGLIVREAVEPQP